MPLRAPFLVSSRAWRLTLSLQLATRVSAASAQATDAKANIMQVQGEDGEAKRAAATVTTAEVRP